MSADTLCWTDIPVTNLDRAINFYSAVLGQEVSKMSEGGIEYGLLPHEEQNASACLCVGSDSAGSDNKPTGSLIYLSVEGRHPSRCSSMARSRQNFTRRADRLTNAARAG
jgi:uncharacterized protein